MLLAGRDITRLGAAARTDLGIGRAFQLTNLFPELSVLENVRLAVQSRERAGFNMLARWRSRSDLIDQAQHYLDARRDSRRALRTWPQACRTATSASSRWRC